MSNQGFGLGGLPYALGFGEFMPQNKSGEEGQRANARLQTQMAQQFFNDTGLVRGPMSSWVTQFMQNGTMPLPLTQALGSVAEAGNTAIGQSYQGAINNLGLRTPMTDSERGAALGNLLRQQGDAYTQFAADVEQRYRAPMARNMYTMAQDYTTAANRMALQALGDVSQMWGDVRERQAAEEANKEKQSKAVIQGMLSAAGGMAGKAMG